MSKALIVSGGFYKSANNPNYRYKVLSAGAKQVKVQAYDWRGVPMSEPMIVKPSFARRDFTRLAD